MKLWAVMSTVLVMLITLASTARAHEVLPSIADMTQVDDRLEFEVRANLEGFIAGIDLGSVADTNLSPQATRYDALRALDPTALAAEFEAYWPRMAGLITVEFDGAPAELTLERVAVGDLGNVEEARNSVFAFSAPVPDGAETVVAGWDASLGVLVLRQMGVDAPYDGYLDGGTLTPAVQLAGGDQASGFMTFLRYIPVGFDHIVPLGLDHILFVLGLFLLSTRLRPLIWQISAFTLAHTITLALAALGIIQISPDIVEPLIALSIAYVAIENLFFDELSPWRPFVIFGLGLLHGLGFASVLGEFGLPDGTFIAALIGFNIGVEVGQLAVVVVAFLIVWGALNLSRRHEASRVAALGYLAAMTVTIALIAPAAIYLPDMVGDLSLVIVTAAVLMGLCAASCVSDKFDSYREMVSMPASVLIALVAIWWTIERVFL